MALLGNPHQIDNALAYHKVASATHPTSISEDGSEQADTGVLNVTVHVFEDHAARVRGDDPIQSLHFSMPAPQDEPDFVRAAYLNAKSRPLWAAHQDV